MCIHMCMYSVYTCVCIVCTHMCMYDIYTHVYVVAKPHMRRPRKTLGTLLYCSLPSVFELSANLGLSGLSASPGTVLSPYLTALG